MKKQLVIVGAGSVGKYISYNINDFNHSFELIGFLDDDPSKHGVLINGFEVLGSTDKLRAYSGKGVCIAWGIAFPKIKKLLMERFSNLDFQYPALVSKYAWISHGVSIGQGSIIYPGCSINYECQIGEFVVMNMNCAIGHNCSIGNFTSLSPGVNLGGNTQVGESVELGIGSSTKQFIEIGKDAIIGGNSMIIKNVSSNEVIVGVPGRPSASNK